MDISNKSIFCSFSGGKDSCLSLYKALEGGANLKYLFTMFTEEGKRSRSHGLELKVIKEQAKSIEAELIIGKASWNNYEEVFIENIKKMEDENIEIGVFGDIDIIDHLRWVENTLSVTKILTYHPLWKEERKKLLKEFVDLGFKAKIVSLKKSLMDKKYLGKTLDYKLINELESIGIDPCGEEGEFHTVVYDGPIFSYPLKY
ncbi:MAG: diphthine--ammonia ligase [Firmicutes bacterium]|nr:diphthine--ammonia ligase [Bacillota bacterium]